MSKRFFELKLELCTELKKIELIIGEEEEAIYRELEGNSLSGSFSLFLMQV
jgi:hypothetical protein